MAIDYTQDANCKYAYLFKEGAGTTVADSSGNGNTGNFKGSGEPAWNTTAPTYGISGVAPFSAKFDNLDDFINAGTSDVVTENSALTYCCWAFQIGAGTNGRIFDRTSVLFYTDQGGDGKALIFQVNGVATLSRPTADATISYGVWQHLAFTWDGSTTATNSHIYLNSVEVSYGSPTNATTPTDNSGQTLYIGNRADAARCYNGYLTDVGIFSRVLTSGEIANIYNYGLKPTAGSIMTPRSGYWGDL